MFRRLLLTVAAFLGLAAIQSAAAQCVEDFRPVAVGEGGVQIKAYVCRSGNTRVKAEFHRLSMAATSILISGGNSPVLGSTIGRPQLVRNDVVAVIDDILDRFTSRYETEYTTPSYFVAVPRGGSAEVWENGSYADLRVLDTDFPLDEGFGYPAVAELSELLRGRIPSNLSRSGDNLWRFMTRDDLTEFASRVAEFNQYYASNAGYQIWPPDGPSPTIALMSYLTQQGMPHDFGVIFGWLSEGGCATGQGWIFEYLPRIPIVDGIVVENMSASSATLSSLLGSSSTGGLRALGGGSGSRPILDVGISLQPGERAFIPTRLVFAPSDLMRPFTTTSYMFGPALDVTGLVVNGQSISFEERSANFTQLTLSPESGSCPYLMSLRDEDGVWIDRGKVLHAANGADKEYSEIVEYEGLRHRFRLEEREPETAFIDAAKLVVELDDGSRLELSPDRPELVARDGERLVFAWGEAVEFAFALPENVERSRVRRSTLHVTGYYERIVIPPVAVEGLSLVPASLDTDALSGTRAELCEPALWQSRDMASAASFLDLSLD